MRILVVSATVPEISPLLARLPPPSQVDPLNPRVASYAHHDHRIDVLTTGVGMVATAAWCARVLSTASYDLAVNLGVCGSFDPSLPPGTVVHVGDDRLAELGAEDGDRFLTIHDLGLLDAGEFPFEHGRLVNADPPAGMVMRSLPVVSGITVSTVHGCERTIAEAVERFHPQVESMEGAAFMYACLIQGVRFAQIRAVSNVVERRNRASWKMAEAIGALGAVAAAMLEQA